MLGSGWVRETLINSLALFEINSYLSQGGLVTCSDSYEGVDLGSVSQELLEREISQSQQ